MMLNTAKRILSLLIVVAFGASAYGPAAAAQTSSRAASTASNENATRSEVDRRAANQTSGIRQLNGSSASELEEEAVIQSQIKTVYLSFYNSYRLGAGDVIAIYIDRHPEDSLERVAVSPVGQIYYPLMGNVAVAGKTLSQLTDYFTASISEYIKEPRVTISLLEANSAKIGVLGDVRDPGVIIMTRPMRVLDAITAARGISETGNSSKVSVLRQYEDGRVQTMTVNVKKILSGKASPEENIYLQAGDTVIVHGNWVKKIGTVSSLMGLSSFFTFLTRRGR